MNNNDWNVEQPTMTYRNMRPPLRYHQLPVDGMWKQRRRLARRESDHRLYHYSVIHDDYLMAMAIRVQRQRIFERAMIRAGDRCRRKRK